jgi:hypothetical protein
MLCCLIGGGLVAWLAKSARRKGSPAPSPLLAMLFGFGAGLLVVELIISMLAPLGVVEVTGPLAARAALVAAPALLALPAARAGAAAALLTRSGTIALTAAAVGGALVAEEADLHVLTLHSAPGVLAGLATHLPVFLFLAGGLAWWARLPEEAILPPSICEPDCRVESPGPNPLQGREI